jgi:predicted  nucleic acid-binding Zn-ribbon protein
MDHLGTGLANFIEIKHTSVFFGICPRRANPGHFPKDSSTFLRLQLVVTQHKTTMNNTFLGTALLVFVLVSQSLALQIISDTNQETRFNDTFVFTERLLTIECTPVDLGLQTPRELTFQLSNGTTQRLGVTCSKPLITYDVNHIGWVPYRSSIYVAEVCMAVGINNPSEDQEARIDRTGISRFLLQAQATDFAVTSRVDQGRKLLQIGLSTAIFSIAGGILGGIIGCKIPFLGHCGGGVSQEAFQQLQDRTSELEAAQANLFQGLQNLTTAFSAQIDLDESRFVNIQQNLESVTTSIVDLKRASQLVQQNLNVLQKQVSAALANISSEISATNTNMDKISAELGNFENSTNERFERLFNQFQNVTRKVVDDINALAQHGDDVDSVRMRSIYDLATQIQTLANTMLKVESREIMLQEMNSLVQQNLNDVTTRRFKPFLIDVGVPPATGSLGANAYINIETVLIRSVFNILEESSLNVVTTHTHFAETVFNLRCGTRFFVNDPQGSRDWSQILQAVGPDWTCTPVDETHPEGPNSCSCWIEVTEKQCVVDFLAPNPFTATTASEAGLYSNPDFDTSTDKSICRSGNPAFQGNTLPPRPLTTVTQIRSMNNFTDLIATFCEKRIQLTNTDHFFLSYAANRMTQMPSTCSSNLLKSFYTQPSSITAMLTMFSAAYGWHMADSAKFKKLVFGVMPSMMQLREEPSVIANGTNIGPCWYSYFIANSPDPWIPVYEIRKVRTSTTVTVQYLDNPSRPNDVYQMDADQMEVILQDESLIPTAEVMVGSPLGTLNHAEGYEIFDIPASQLIVDVVSEVRKGTVPYQMIYQKQNESLLAQSELTEALWREQNAFSFEATAAVNSAYLHRVKFDHEEGVCLPFDEDNTPLIGGGSWCDRMAVMTVGFSKDAFSPTKGVMTIQPSRANIRVQVRVPEGVVISSVRSACPGVGYVYSSAGELALTLVNPLSTINDLVVKRESTSAACVSEMPVSLSAGGKQTLRYSFCALLGPVPDSIHIYVKTSFTDLVACPVNITLHPAIVNAQAPASTSYLETRVIYINDLASQAFAQVSYKTLNIIAEMIMDVVRPYRASNIDIPDVVYDDTALRLARLQAIRDSINQTITQAQNDVTNFTQANASYQQELDQTYSDLDKQIANQTALNTQLRAINIQGQEGALKIHELNNRLADLEQKMIIAQQNYDKAVLEGFASTMSSSGGCSGLFDSIGCFFSTLYTFAIYAAIGVGVFLLITCVIIPCCRTAKAVTPSVAPSTTTSGVHTLMNHRRRRDQQQRTRRRSTDDADGSADDDDDDDVVEISPLVLSSD